MDGVQDVHSNFPSIVEYPATSFRSKIAPAEWQACLDSWLLTLEMRLRLRDEEFSRLHFSPLSSDMKFLTSYCESCVAGKPLNSSARDSQLHRRSYLLFKRVLLDTHASRDWTPPTLVDCLLLADQAFHTLPDWRQTLEVVHRREPGRLSTGFDSWKATVMKTLNIPGENAFLNIQRMNSLIVLLPEAGLALMTGSDYLEALIISFEQHTQARAADSSERILTEHLCRALRSLMSDQTNHTSILLDHLYLLRTESEGNGKNSQQPSISIFSSLICTTSFIRQLSHDKSVMGSKRGRGIVDELLEYRQQVIHLHSPPVVSSVKRSKGKTKAVEDDNIHVHTAAQLSQIHDLFPDLPNRYILQLLDRFDNNLEDVVAALLEPDSLPTYLQVPEPGTPDAADDTRKVDQAPRITPPPPERRNVYDNDEFDALNISSAQLHRGRRDVMLNEHMADGNHARSKAAIMTALAAFDSDDDERDDSYDVADVGGSVDQSADTDSRDHHSKQQPDHEESLYMAWKASPDLFARDSKTRVSPVRQDLKRQTGMSDEQIEGWAIMLGRNKVLQDRLQKKYQDAVRRPNTQRILEQTKWRHNSSQEASTDEDDAPANNTAPLSSRTGQAQSRGGPTFGRGRGGSTSGQNSDPATQAARRRKEQGRGRGGGHNKRDVRAKKMGRGMAGPPAQ